MWRTRDRWIYGPAYSVGAALTLSLVLPAALPRGGPSTWAIIAVLLVALAGAPLVGREKGAPWRGAGLALVFWATQTIAGGIAGGLAATGVGAGPGQLTGNTLWLGLRGLAGALIAFPAARIPGPAGAIIGGLAYALSQLSLPGLAFAGSLGILAWRANDLLLGTGGAVLAGERGFWASAGFLAVGEALLGATPLVGGVTPLARALGGLAGLAVVLLLVGRGSQRSPLPARRALAYLSVLVLPLLGAASGVRVVVVTSGSMEPALHVGDLAIVTPGEPAVGDVVLYRHGRGLVIHRVVAESGGTLTTRGDANPGPDPWRVGGDSVVGVMRLRVPLAGRPLLWLRSALEGSPGG